MIPGIVTGWRNAFAVFAEDKWRMPKKEVCVHEFWSWPSKSVFYMLKRIRRSLAMKVVEERLAEGVKQRRHNGHLKDAQRECTEEPGFSQVDVYVAYIRRPILALERNDLVAGRLE